MADKHFLRQISQIVKKNGHLTSCMRNLRCREKGTRTTKNVCLNSTRLSPPLLIVFGEKVVFHLNTLAKIPEHLYYNSKTNATFIKQKQPHRRHCHIEIGLKQYDKIVQTPSLIFDKRRPKFQHLFCSITWTFVVDTCTHCVPIYLSWIAAKVGRWLPE